MPPAIDRPAWNRSLLSRRRWALGRPDQSHSASASASHPQRVANARRLKRARADTGDERVGAAERAAACLKSTALGLRI